MNTKEFKDEYVVFYYSDQLIKNIKEDIENLYYELTGVKGYDYTKTPIAFNQQLYEEKRHDIMHFITIKQAELVKIKSAYDHMYLLIPKFTDEQLRILNRILIYNESYEKVGSEIGYSASSMWRYVENFIENAIRTTYS